MVDKVELRLFIFIGVFVVLFFTVANMYESSIETKYSSLNTTDAANLSLINESMHDWGLLNPIAPILNILTIFFDLFTFNLGDAFVGENDPLLFGAIHLTTLIYYCVGYPATLAFLWIIIKLVRG